MSTFEMEQIRHERGIPSAPPKDPTRKAAHSFHWDRANYYKSEPENRWGGSGMTLRSEPQQSPAPWMSPSKLGNGSYNIRATDWGYGDRLNAVSGISHSEIMRDEDPLCREARLKVTPFARRLLDSPCQDRRSV